MPATGTVLVAGHLCLDVKPEIMSNESCEQLFVPGKLIDAGAMSVTCGGAVFNTGISLHRLGIHTRLVGKVGRDLFGELTLKLIESQGEALKRDILIDEQEQSSYSILLNPPHEDRIIVHHVGANATFTDQDVDDRLFDDVRLFHFGYPPLLKRFYEDGGARLIALLGRAKQKQVITSLDMALVGPGTEAGQVGWSSYLARVLPLVDLFVPSFEEIYSMLRQEEYVAFKSSSRQDVLSLATQPLLRMLANELLALGPLVVGIKLGEHGLYMKTTHDASRLSMLQQTVGIQVEQWVGLEMQIPCYEVEVSGTTGAGDATIAGFLAGVLHGESLRDAMHSAVATGAYSVSGLTAVDQIPKWQKLKQWMSDRA